MNCSSHRPGVRSACGGRRLGLAPPSTVRQRGPDPFTPAPSPVSLFLLILATATTLPAADRQLTNDHRYKRDPVFLDANTLIYVVQARPEQLQLVRRDLKSGKQRPVHKDETRSELEPAVSPDGRFLAFLQSRSAASVGMVIEDTKLQKTAEIPPASGFSGMRSPAFSHDGKRVLYVFAEGGRQKVFSCNTSAGDRKVLVDVNGICNWPSISRDGRMLLYGSTRDGNYEIYRARASDGSNPRRLTHHRSQDVRPRFSPDGRRVVFVSNRDGNREIYVMGADGSGVTRVTEHPERDDYPTWHPDGKRIVYVAERKGGFDLRLRDVP
jgi:Tol biopolymer transport system component